MDRARKNKNRQYASEGKRDARDRIKRQKMLEILSINRQDSSSDSDEISSTEGSSTAEGPEATVNSDYSNQDSETLENNEVPNVTSSNSEEVSNISENNEDSHHSASENSSSSHPETGSDSSSDIELDDDQAVGGLVPEVEQVILNPDNYVREQLAEWASSNVSKRKVDDLLRRLKPVHRNLPLSYKTLLQTPTSIDEKDCGNGTFWYRGIVPNLNQLLSNEYFEEHEEILIDVNIDSVPLHKNKRKSFTPILGRLVGVSTPFIIGVFHGAGEPHELDLFLEDFVKEVNHLLKFGYEFGGRVYTFRIRHYILDQKARALIKRVKGVRGYYCCERCVVKGTDFMNRMCLLEHNCQLRTDESFIELASKLMAPLTEHFDDDETDEHVIGISPLLECEKKLVSKFRLDSMHLIYKGVFLRWLTFICSGRGNYRLSNQAIAAISGLLEQLVPFIPQDFNRKPQPLHLYASYKATELRRMLLYDGLVVFSKFLDENLYKNFLLLHSAIYILVSPKYCQVLTEEADRFLRAFVTHSTEVFGAEFTVYNVHSTVHLAGECEDHGPLDNFGAFPFENKLKSIKEALRSGYQPLQQIARREIEKIRFTKPYRRAQFRTELKMPHVNDANEATPGKQYKKLVLEKMTFFINQADSCCTLKDGSVCKIENFIQSVNGDIVIIGKKFLTTDDFYNYPLPSHLLGILKVSDLSSRKQSWSPIDIDLKCMLLPLGEGEEGLKLCVPLCHTS